MRTSLDESLEISAVPSAAVEPSRSNQGTTQFQAKMASEFWINIGGKDFRLVGKSVRIGRAPDNDIILDHKSCSRYHALISLQNDRVTIEDLKSRNGVKVNGSSIQALEIKDNDEIRIGEVQGTFCQRLKKSAPPKASNLSQAKLNLHTIVEDFKSNFKVAVPSQPKLGKNKKMVLVSLGICALAFLSLMFVSGSHSAPEVAASAIPVLAESPVSAPFNKQLFEKCLEAEDLGNFRQATECLKKLPSTMEVGLAKERVKQRQDELVEKSYQEGAQAFDNYYYDIAILKWQEVLLISDDSSEYRTKAIAGIQRAEERRRLR